ncbi:MAG: DUF4962 domain-containing protein [Planctomycetes bacterium]|nr:DUF4962 domain-containing protein [Planctomycetota bacterium]
MPTSAMALSLLLATAQQAPVPQFDDAPAGAAEWGYRPADGAELTTAVHAFCWRPQRGAVGYRLQVAGDAAFGEPVADREDLTLPVWCRPSLPPGRELFWRCAFRTAADAPWSAWSRTRRFTLAADAGDGADGARAFDRERILAALPTAHPRLFFRPEDLPRLRTAAGGDLAANAAALVARCERLLGSPPDVTEPLRYPAGTVRGSEPWRELWWGNRTKTIAVLENASTLAFTARITGRDDFGALAERLLLAAASWDPHGATGYRYNDEAGMPFAYWFARTYTLLHDRLDEAARARCREVMRQRGDEIYRHLCPNHLWRPFNSHSNRAWHFLGEVGIAFHDEIDAAPDWLWFAMNVFGACYPVWSGNEDDGGWHEGMAYWQSYLTRFSWWADIMRAATGVDAYRESPFFARAGNWPLFVTPPGTRGSGFGDLTARRTSKDQARLVALFAQQARNGVWQWYADQHGDAGKPRRDDWIEYVRGIAAPVAAVPPDPAVTSRLFRGIGQAALNTTLQGARSNVEVLFKSSPFGTQSHGYEAQNSFLLYAFGERLLIRSGRRDTYGSAHHSRWMWSTRSTNSITLDGGTGQGRRTPDAVGEIVAFRTTDWCDWVEGEAGRAYGGKVASFRRGILFVKPHAVLVFDRIRTDAPHTFDLWLHAEQPFELGDQRAELRVGAAACAIDWLTDAPLMLAQTDRFDPPPLPRIRLVEHHLTASTREPANAWECLTVLRPHRADAEPIGFAVIDAPAGFARALELRTPGGPVTVALARDGSVSVTGTAGRTFAVRGGSAGR